MQGRKVIALTQKGKKMVERERTNGRERGIALIREGRRG